MKLKKYIIVTGASGFIGKNLINKFISRNDTKYIFIYRTKRPVLTNNNLKNFVFLKLDLTKKKNFNKLPKKRVSIIYHLAAEPNTFAKYDSIDSQFSSNTKMAMNIANYCKETKVKYLFFSSSVYVYSGTDKKKFKINDRTYPKEILGTSKLSSELIFNSFSSFMATKIIILRFFTIYGPGANPSQFIPTVIRKIKNSKKSITFYKNSISRDFIYISDIINILLLLQQKLSKIEKNYTILNIGSGRKTRVLFVIKYLLKIIKPKIKTNFVSQNKKIAGDNSHCADISDLIKIINYKPKVLIRDGLKKLI